MVMKDYDREELLRLIKEANEITKIMTNPDSYVFLHYLGNIS